MAASCCETAGEQARHRQRIESVRFLFLRAHYTCCLGPNTSRRRGQGNTRLLPNDRDTRRHPENFFVLVLISFSCLFPPTYLRITYVRRDTGLPRSHRCDGGVKRPVRRSDISKRGGGRALVSPFFFIFAGGGWPAAACLDCVNVKDGGRRRGEGDGHMEMMVFYSACCCFYSLFGKGEVE